MIGLLKSSKITQNAIMYSFLFNGRNSSSIAHTDKYISAAKNFHVCDAQVAKAVDGSMEFRALMSANESMFNGTIRTAEIAPNMRPTYRMAFLYLKKIACFKSVPNEERENVVKIGTIKANMSETRNISFFV